MLHGHAAWVLAMATVLPAAAADDELSVGRVGLLVASPDAPGAADTIAAGLRHARPEVRAAAARAAFAFGVPSLTTPLTAALREETDVWAAVEQVRALSVLGDAGMDTALLEASGRLGPNVAAAAAEALARRLGAAAIDVIPGLRTRGLRDPRPLLRLAASGNAGALTRAGSAALRDVDAETWAAVLELTEESDATLSDGLFVAAAGAKSPALRAATFWHLAGRAEPLPDALRQALARSPEANSSDADVEAAFAYEVLSRALGRPPRRDRAWLDRIAIPARMSLPRFTSRPRLIELLTKEERRAVSRRVGSGEDLLDQALKASKQRPLPGQKSPATGEIWLLSGLPPGFASAVTAAAGCQPKQDEVAAAQVRFRPEGRPAFITLKMVPAGPGCLEASKALFAALVAPSWRLPNEAEDLVVVKFDRESLACIDEPPDEATRLEPPPGGADIRAPKKVKDVRPHYPREARDGRIEGAVVLEASLTRTGCIRGLRVLSGPPALTVAALAAVSQWRYAPAALRGEPFPVTMTITVNFRLR